VAIIGGGAAGFFSAIAVKENFPDARVTVFEKSLHVLAKVKISGGGRCNVTHACSSVSELCKAYPRGGKQLKKIFPVFNTMHARHWFESRGVPLVIQEDGCIFPASQDSQSIIDCFLRESRRLGIQIETGKGIKSLVPRESRWELHFQKEEMSPECFDKVIVTTGGSPRRSGLEWLESLGHRIEEPVPSLFTFHMPSEPVTRLMGVVVENAIVTIQGTKCKSNGPLLITHWGMSGPAILKLSSYGARILSESGYAVKIQVNWVNEPHCGMVNECLMNISKENPRKLLSNIRPYGLPARLWQFLLEKTGQPESLTWGDLGKKGLNKLVNILTNDEYQVKGKATFKEEFVTCGGVSLESIDINTLQSKTCKNLYFAGEVLDIDAITGGYNFQAAWTTGYIAGQLFPGFP
jgi:predicted Rossmann fold flavoprotein